MSGQKVKEFKGWFISNLSLEEIGKIFKESKLINDFQYDYENVYEWIEAKTKNKDVLLNISRQHCDFEGFENEPIHILVVYFENEPSDEEVIQIASQISKLFDCKVSLGFIDYLIDDNFEYKTIREIYSH